MRKLWEYLTRFETWWFPCVRIMGNTDNATVYLTRFFLTPVTRWGAVYLHCFHRPDMDRDPHDHPFNFWTLPLGRGYVEEVFEHASDCFQEVYVPPWRWSLRPARHRHRILRPERGGWPMWTLVVRGRNVRKWGFWTHSSEFSTVRHWTPWKTYCYGERGNANVQGHDDHCPGRPSPGKLAKLQHDHNMRSVPSPVGEQFLPGERAFHRSGE